MAAAIAQKDKTSEFLRDNQQDLKTGAVITSDQTYRDVLGASVWQRLKPEIRSRFSTKPRSGQMIGYSGVMQRVELSLMGWLFAQACRMIGTPLAPYRGANVPMRIELMPDEKLDGIAWHRLYEFPQKGRFTVRSTKCKGSNGEFIEHIGCGFSMRLVLSELDGDLVFKSIAYDFSLFGRKFRIPDLLTPGVTTVTHEQQAGDRFRFTLSVDHPKLGRTIFQEGEFYSEVSDV